jgi:hypothetical protein
VNDCKDFGTKTVNCTYEVMDLPKTFVHAYDRDPEGKRSVGARIFIVAKRDIEGGEEITSNYGRSYWRKPQAAQEDNVGRKKRLHSETVGVHDGQVKGCNTKKLFTDQGLSGKRLRGSPACTGGSPGQFRRVVASVEGQLRRSRQRALTVNTGQDGGGPQAREEVSRRFTALKQVTLPVLPVQDFSEKMVEQVLRTFNNQKAAYGHVEVMKLQQLPTNTNLEDCCQSLLKAKHVFKSVRNTGVTFQELELGAGQCRLRVEHNLHDDKVKGTRRTLYSEPLTSLVHEHFHGSAFQKAWDLVARIISTTLPRRKPRLVLMATGDCRKLHGTETIGGVTFTAGGQLVKCHWDGYHVVCFVVKGRKDFRVAEHRCIRPGAQNPNHAHHVNALDVEFAHLFRVAEIPADHVLFMEFKTWHEVCVETPLEC